MISKKIRRTKLCVLISIAVPSYLTQSANYSDSDVNMFYAICIPRKKLPVGSFFLLSGIRKYLPEAGSVVEYLISLLGLTVSFLYVSFLLEPLLVLFHYIFYAYHFEWFF